MNLRWQSWAIILALLYYLPYYFQNLLCSDTALHAIYPNHSNIFGNFKAHLISQAKPLYGVIVGVVNRNIGISPEMITLIGVLCFTFATIKIIELLFNNLSYSLKLLLFLVLFVNPFIYNERFWFEQFLGQGIVAILYYYAFYFILKYKHKPFNIAKLALAYAYPIISVVIGTSFFMPSFFNFLILAVVVILRQHARNPFNNFNHLFKYSCNLIVVISLSIICFIATIVILWYSFDYSIGEYMARRGRSTGLNIVERLFTLITSQQFPMFYNIVGIVFAGVLLLTKRSKVSIFLFGMVVIVIFSSYFFYVILDRKSTYILNFPNYYFTFFMIAIVLENLQKNSKKQVLYVLKLIAILFILFMYSASYFVYRDGYMHHKYVENNLNAINDYVVKKYKTSKNPKIIIISNHNTHTSQYKYVTPHFLDQFFTKILHYSKVEGHHFGLPNIKPWRGKISDKYILEQKKRLTAEAKFFPHEQSIFYYNGIYHVMN